MLLNKLIDTLDKKNVVLTATLLLFLLNSSSYGYIEAVISMLCMAALILPSLRPSKFTWGIILLIFLAGNMTHYFEIDNHKFLYIYWSFAILACLFSDDFEQDIKINAKLLTGLVFGLAVLWKLFSPDYLDNSFFLSSFLLNERFTGFVKAFHLLPDEMMLQNKNTLTHLLNESTPPYQVQLHSSNIINKLSAFFSWGGMIIELMIAVLFLLPGKLLISRSRDYFLFIFIGVTYLIAPVWGFGSILSIMGFAQADSKRKSIVYLVLFLLMQFYKFPFYRLFHF